MPSEPRKANLAGTVSWSDGTPFTGYIYIGVAFPTSVDPNVTYATVWMNNQYPPQRLPKWYKIPIVQGVYEQTARIYYTADINPPNTRYCYYFYDVNGNLLYGPSALFTVTTTPHTITYLTLPVPTVGTVAPDPNDNNPPDDISRIIYAQFVDNETPSGTINGVNATFLLTRVPVPATSLTLYKNGQLLYPTVGYTLSDQTITFLTGYIPRTGDLLRASYRLSGDSVAAAITGGYITNEIPTGAVDGSNLAYTLVFSPSPADSLQLYKNGQLLIPGTAYTLASSTITITAPYLLETGDSLRATYRF
jgi:hypothetical protein